MWGGTVVEKSGEGPKLLSQPESFQEILLEAVDEGLMVLGESPRAAIYFHIEKYSSLKKDEVPQRLNDFSTATRKIFGMGEPVMEKLILKRLCQKLNVNYESVKGREFQVAVEEIRKRSGGPT